MNKFPFMLLILLFSSLSSFSFTNGHEGIAIYFYDQPIVDDIIVVEDTFSEVEGWIVIYNNDNGQRGNILGYSPINKWYTLYVQVELSQENRTPILHAMMHADEGIVGNFEPEIDQPIRKHNDPENDYFESIQIGDELEPLLEVSNQKIVNNKIVIDKAISSGPGWIVVFSVNNGEIRNVLGKKAIFHGINEEVEVRLNESGRTNRVTVSLIHDYGTAGEFEYMSIDVPYKNQEFDLDKSILIENDTSTGDVLNGTDNFMVVFAVMTIVLLKHRSVKCFTDFISTR